MKKNFAIYIIAAALASGLAGCQKEVSREDLSSVLAIAESPEKTAVDPSGLPPAVLEFMKEEHFSSFISDAYLSPQLGYELITSDEDHIFFSLEGRPLADESTEWREGEYRRFGGPCARPGRYIRPQQLPGAVRRYIRENYDGDTPLRAKILANGMIVVGMNPPLMLVFTEQGRFVEEVYCFRPCETAMWRVRVADLPEILTEYLRTHYSGLEALAAYECRNGNFVIGLFIDGQRLILVFDEEGNFLHLRG